MHSINTYGGIPYLLEYKAVMIIRRGGNWEHPRKKEKLHTNIRWYRVVNGLLKFGGDRLKYWIINTAKMQNGDREIVGEESFNTQSVGYMQILP